MNWLLLIVIVYMILSIISGYRKGLIRTVCSVLAMMIALIIASVCSPMVSRALESNKGIYEYVDEKVSDVLNIDSKISGVTEQAKYINSLRLPESIKEQLKVNNNSEVKNELKVSEFSDYVTGFITCLILNAISYIVVFIVALLLIGVVINVLDLISKLPVLNAVNKLGGAIAGAAKSLVVIWVFFVLITVFSGSDFGQTMFKMINDSTWLSFLYNNNILMNVILGVARTLF